MELNHDTVFNMDIGYGINKKSQREKISCEIL